MSDETDRLPEYLKFSADSDTWHHKYSILEC